MRKTCYRLFEIRVGLTVWDILGYFKGRDGHFKIAGYLFVAITPIDWRVCTPCECTKGTKFVL